MHLDKLVFCLSIILVYGCGTEKTNTEPDQFPQNPNIIVVYLDDLGYGDVSFNGASDINTENMDKLAEGGVVFTNGYATSATCTPSRYALLTGQYPWRRKEAKILPGTAPLIIDTDQNTLPSMLKKNGYHTAVIGKWHLGLGDGQVNWNDSISPGPNDIGFDYSYIMAATQDRVPTVYLENGLVKGLDTNDPIEVSYDNNFVGEPTGLANPELMEMTWHHGHNGTIINGIPRIGFMKGGKDARWKDEEMADTFINEVKSYIKSHKEDPFFLYYALQQPHVPRTPHPRFKGKSGMGPRGDVILEADWCIGELIKTLEEQGILENTLLIFSSDNGPVINDGYNDQSVEKLGEHTPGGKFRGGKYSLFEAGTHVPFFTYWKGVIKPGKSDALVSQMDIPASIAALIESNTEFPDSKNLLPEFLGKSDKGRDSYIIEATSRTAFRQGDWVMIPPYDGPAVNEKVNIELGNLDDYGLYDLSKDPSQQKNLAKKHPEKLKELLDDFIKLRGDSFSEIEQLELK